MLPFIFLWWFSYFCFWDFPGVSLRVNMCILFNCPIKPVVSSLNMGIEHNTSVCWCSSGCLCSSLALMLFLFMFALLWPKVVLIWYLIWLVNNQGIGMFNLFIKWISVYRFVKGRWFVLVESDLCCVVYRYNSYLIKVFLWCFTKWLLTENEKKRAVYSYSRS